MQMNLNLSVEEEEVECPLCMEEMDISDRNFKPCPCGYQICRFCWNHIRQNVNNKCPACRREYSEHIVEFTPVTPAEIQKFKNEKKQAERERKEMEANNRRHLANMRVVQKNLVYIIGLSARIATEELLRQHDYFGQYGKILKIVVNKRSLGNYNQISHKADPTLGVYVTFATKDDAAKCIGAIDGTVYEGRVLRASYGTTKYCSFYLRGLQCQNAGCMYLHEPGQEADSFTKEEMNQGKHHGKSGYNLPGSPLVGEGGVVGPAAPFGVNAPHSQENGDSTPRRKPAGGKSEPDEWPAPTNISVGGGSPAVLPKQSAWAQKSQGSSLSLADKRDDRVECDIFSLIHPDSRSPGAGTAPGLPLSKNLDSAALINTAHLHRYLSLARQARDYYMQLSQSAVSQGIPASQISTLFAFDPFRDTFQEQSRFGFAQQSEDVHGLAARMRSLNTSAASEQRAQ